MKFLKVLLWFCCALAMPCHGGEKSKLVSNLEAGKKQVVVAYGTSLTAGGAWVKHLATTLDAEYPGLATVVNSGGSGQWSEWGVANLDEKVIAKKPDTVFIEFSMNDSVERFQGSVEIAKANLENMISRILKANPQCEIILMTMPPGDKHPAGHKSYRKDIGAHYGMYRSIAKERGFLLIDHHRNWMALRSKDRKLFDEYVPDTIHPEAKGCEEIVTPVILDALGIK
jgi:acyl-CoA thioesterase I